MTAASAYASSLTAAVTAPPPVRRYRRPAVALFAATIVACCSTAAAVSPQQTPLQEPATALVISPIGAGGGPPAAMKRLPAQAMRRETIPQAKCVRETGATCTSLNCAESRNAFCQDSLCVCPTGSCAINGQCNNAKTPKVTDSAKGGSLRTVAADGTCEKEIAGSMCGVPNRCDESRNAVCKDNTCVCAADMCAVDGKCTKTAIKFEPWTKKSLLKRAAAAGKTDFKIDMPPTFGRALQDFWKSYVWQVHAGGKPKNGPESQLSNVYCPKVGVSQVSLTSGGNFGDSTDVKMSVDTHCKGEYCWQHWGWMSEGNFRSTTTANLTMTFPPTMPDVSDNTWCVPSSGKVEDLNSTIVYKVLGPTAELERTHSQDSQGAWLNAVCRAIWRKTQLFTGEENAEESPLQRSASSSVANSEAHAEERGWKLSEGIMYQMFSRKESWYAAEASCAWYGGHLATIESKSQAEFVRSMFDGKAAWIGLQMDTPSKTWSWVDENPSSYRGWAAGQPSTIGLTKNDNTGESCAYLCDDLDDGCQDNTKFRNDVCSKEMFFVCSKEAKTFHCGPPTGPIVIGLFFCIVQLLLCAQIYRRNVQEYLKWQEAYEHSLKYYQTGGPPPTVSLGPSAGGLQAPPAPGAPAEEQLPIQSQATAAPGATSVF